jgi:hypothetical protein
MGLFAKDTEEEKFWKWFKENETRIFEFEKDQKPIFDEISDKLSKYQDGLVFEFSSIKDAKREFVLSADGIKEIFPAVRKLTNAAPKFKKWTIIAFRPRMDDYTRFKLEYGKKIMDPKELWIHHRIEDGNFDLIVYHPDYVEEDRNAYVSCTYILLDMALGEYDVTTGIRYIDHQKLPENPSEEGLKPFSELRAAFDNYKKKIKG